MQAEEVLTALGFTQYEARVYLTLQSLGTAGVTELSKQSHVPRNKVYETAASLQAKGAVMSLPVKPQRFTCQPPEKLLEILAEKKAILDTTQRETKQLITRLREKPIQQSQELVWMTKGQRHILQRIALEIAKCQTENVGCTAGSVDYILEQKETQAALRRGVKMRLLVSHSTKKHTVTKWLHAGVQIRMYNEKKYGPQGIRFGVFDNRICRVTIGEPDVKNPDEYITIWSESPSMIRMLKNQFEFMWKEAQPLKKS